MSAANETTGFKAVLICFLSFAFLALLCFVAYQTDSFKPVHAIVESVGSALLLVHLIQVFGSLKSRR